MMHGSLVYSNTGLTPANNTVSISHHTYAIYLLNISSTDDSTVLLNDKYSIFLPHSPNQSSPSYVEVPGDYTTIKVLTANTTVAIYAIG